MGGCARSGERGQSLPLIIMMFVVLCGFVGLTIDVGFGLLQKRRLQAAVDLGALSGAQELPGNAAGTVATTYTRNNFSLVSNQHVNVTSTTSCMIAGCSAHDRLRLTASTQTPTFFLQLFGINDWTVAARGAACGPCDSSVATFDVIVVFDRSLSMTPTDMANAKNGVKELLEYFDPSRDRVGLAVLESEDMTPPYFRTNGSNTYCYNAGTSRRHIIDTAAPSSLPSTYAREAVSFGGSQGAFMDNTNGQHDRWLVVSLAQGTNFKNANGTLNNNSTFLRTLTCIANKGYTPIGPAVEAATNELDQNGREDAVKVIVYLGDGGANIVPMTRQCQQRSSKSGAGSTWPTTWRACVDGDMTADQDLRQWRLRGVQSWYQWTSGNRDRPCQDAIQQADRADNLGIEVYTIGYGVENSACRLADPNRGDPQSPSITQRDTIRRMASQDSMFYNEPKNGDVRGVFAQIGREITAGGTRLVE